MCLCPILCVAIFLSFGLLFFFSNLLLFFHFSFSFVVVIRRFIAADVCLCTCCLNILNVRITEFVCLFVFSGGIQNCCYTMSYYWFHIVTASMHADFDSNNIHSNARTHAIQERKKRYLKQKAKENKLLGGQREKVHLFSSNVAWTLIECVKVQTINVHSLWFDKCEFCLPFVEQVIGGTGKSNK